MIIEEGGPALSGALLVLFVVDFDENVFFGLNLVLKAQVLKNQEGDFCVVFSLMLKR